MMKRIDAALDRADGALRAWLMGGRIPGWLLELLTFEVQVHGLPFFLFLQLVMCLHGSLGLYF